MKIKIEKGINEKGNNYRSTIFTDDNGTEEPANYELSRRLTNTDNETDSGVFAENSYVIVRKGQQSLELAPITPDMDDTARAKIMLERIRTAKQWADNIAVKIITEVSG